MFSECLCFTVFVLFAVNFVVLGFVYLLVWIEIGLDCCTFDFELLFWNDCGLFEFVTFWVLLFGRFLWDYFVVLCLKWLRIMLVCVEFGCVLVVFTFVLGYCVCWFWLLTCVVLLVDFVFDGRVAGLYYYVACLCFRFVFHSCDCLIWFVLAWFVD